MNGIRRCNSMDMPTLRELFKSAYSHNPRMQEQDYFDWQYLHNPYQPQTEYSFYVNEQNANINAFLGFWPFRFWHKNQLLVGCFAQNWYTFTQDTTGLKLLNTLMESFDNRLLLGLSESSHPICKMYRIPCVDKMPRLLYMLQHQTLETVLNKKIAIPHRISDTTTDRGDYSRTLLFDTERDFSPTHNGKKLNGLYRTGHYLNWRYFDIPSHQYTAFSNNLGQFAVFRTETITDTPYDVLRILEWSFDDSTTPSALAYLKNQLDDNVIMMDFFCTSSEIRQHLMNSGFIDENILATSIPYLFRPLHSATTGIHLAFDLPPHRTTRKIDANEWYLTKGDSDLDRVKL